MTKVKPQAIENRQAIEKIRARYLRGQITMGAAEKEAKPIIDHMNKRGAEIAKEHGAKPFHKFRFQGLIR